LGENPLTAINAFKGFYIFAAGEVMCQADYLAIKFILRRFDAVRKIIILLITCFILAVSAQAAFAAKNYDLVLVHGLSNKHQWSDAFLKVCANTWGSGNVYILYLNSDNTVSERTVDGKKIISIGKNDYSAGDDYVDAQAGMMAEKINILQQSHGLSSQMDIIAHSMGGLVCRRYIYLKPNTVAGLVTLGTPHHGSPLADDLDWAGFFIGAEKAVENLKPSWVENFNKKYPVPGSLYNGGKIFTIRGDADGFIWEWGVLGEIYAGWNTLTLIHWTDSDGAVPKDSPLITGATHIADFWDYDHYELVREAAVATKAAQYLP
jgi:pimeloyl-ACP methyl ester carboxylesterase